MSTRKRRASIQSVYWINLDRSTDRKQRMMHVFQDPFFEGFHIHRVPALDGKDPTFLSLLKQCQNVYLTKEHPPPIYACTLSHVKAIQTFVQSGEDMALICEDDLSMEFKPTKRQLDSCIQKAPNDWEILQLYYFPKGELPRRLYTENTIIDHYNPALAYVIRRKGALRFLQEHIHGPFVFDLFVSPSADNYLYSKMKTYVYKYPLFVPPPRIPLYIQLI
jgi:glycosyl transferase family 25